MNTNWIQVTVTTSSFGIETVCAVLYELGITGLEIDDAEDFKKFLDENRASWDYVDDELYARKSTETCVKLYLSDDLSGYELLNSIKSAIHALKCSDSDNLMGSLSVSLNQIKEEDWANNWKKYFKPLTVGDNILICPEWENVPQNSDRIIFKINPGMSFGTGSHETTQLCIEQIEKYIKKGDKILDLGCGSGILSIISLLLGAERASAVDIDPNAVKIALENAEKNGIDLSKYSAVSANILSDEKLRKVYSDEKYDIVLANIVADVIIALLPYAPGFIKSGGMFITSGIINSRYDEVLKACKKCPELEITETHQKGEWASITMKKL